jgi:hypothetical protein
MEDGEHCTNCGVELNLKELTLGEELCFRCMKGNS